MGTPKRYVEETIRSVRIASLTLFFPSLTVMHEYVLAADGIVADTISTLNAF